MSNDATQNPGNLRKGLAQSSMMKSLVHANASTPLWKTESQPAAAQREDQIARLVGNQVSGMVNANKTAGLGAGNNFKFWLRGGVAEGEVVK